MPKSVQSAKKSTISDTFVYPATVDRIVRSDSTIDKEVAQLRKIVFYYPNDKPNGNEFYDTRIRDRARDEIYAQIEVLYWRLTLEQIGERFDGQPGEMAATFAWEWLHGSPDKPSKGYPCDEVAIAAEVSAFERWMVENVASLERPITT